MRTAAGEVRQIVRAATAEAQHRRDRFVGTEHLLLGVTSDPAGLGVRALGVSLEDLRAALDRADRAALEAIGIDAELASADLAPTAGGHRRGRLFLTSGAKRLLHSAVVQSRLLGEREIGARHVLLALLATAPPDPACQVLHLVGVDVDAARQVLLPVTAAD